MFENIMKFFKKINKKDEKVIINSRDAAKERLHLVLMQDRANVSADFLELMKQEIIEVIKKYIDVDENAIDVRLTNKENEDGTNGAPALYANIPILNIKNEARKAESKGKVEEVKEKENKKEAEKVEKIKKEEKEQKKEKTEKKAKSNVDTNKENNNNNSEDKKEDKNEVSQEKLLEKGEIKEETKEEIKSEK